MSTYYCGKHGAKFSPDQGCPDCQKASELASVAGSAFSVGQAVTPLRPLGDDPSGDSPGGIYSHPGEKLIVRRIGGGTFPISVSHEDITDQTFGVKPEEITHMPNSELTERPTLTE